MHVHILNNNELIKPIYKKIGNLGVSDGPHPPPPPISATDTDSSYSSLQQLTAASVNSRLQVLGVGGAGEGNTYLGGKFDAFFKCFFLCIFLGGFLGREFGIRGGGGGQEIAGNNTVQQLTSA